MTNFWNDLPKPFFILAPMEAVTDVVFRHVIATAASPDVFFTEFTATDSYFSEKGRASTRGRLAFTGDEQPIVAQIWGSTPEHFAFMSSGLKEQGFAGIDINMGCPAKDVVKTGGGSGLIRTPQLASEVIAAAKASGLPVSVKTRLGDIRADEWRDWLTHILKQDVVNLTIHLRTRKEMSKVEAHFELIPEIVALRDEIAPQTLLTINGDIRDRAHGLELIAKYPGVNGIMIGRGVFTNPFAFEVAETSSPFLKGDVPVRASRAPWANASALPIERPLKENGDEVSDNDEHKTKFLNLLRYHLDLFDKYALELEPRPFDSLKRFFKIYIRDFPGASELRDALMHTKNTDEVRTVLQTIE